MRYILSRQIGQHAALRAILGSLLSNIVNPTAK